MFEGLLSPMHVLIILVIVAIFFGAKRLPELGKGLGSGIREFKSGLNELHSDVTDDEPAPVPVQPLLTAAEAPGAVGAGSGAAPAATDPSVTAPAATDPSVTAPAAPPESV